MTILIIGLLSVFGMVTVLNVMFWPRIRRSAAGQARGHANQLSVLIPARNEGLTIDACLRSVLDQGDIVREVLVYDDCSTDDTAPRVLAVQKTDSRVRLVSGGGLPSGWCGKPHACMQLAKQGQSPWMLFLDADARMQPGAAAALIETATLRNLTMLSGWPAFELRNASEQFLMPMLNFVVYTLFPAVASLFSNRPQLGVAHGVCILVDRSAYFKIGGHALVRNELFEDTVLARRWREHGEHSLCLDGQEIVSVRMYENLGAIWRGFQKNFYPGFQSRVSFWGFLTLHFVVYLLPFLSLACMPSGPAATWMLIAVLGILMIRLALVIRFRQPLWSALAHPLAEIFLLALGISSWWRWAHGSGVTWKNRSYSPHTGGGVAGK
jgi:glycosyltransferase involved in cell wall biosynthesis